MLWVCPPPSPHQVDHGCFSSWIGADSCTGKVGMSVLVKGLAMDFIRQERNEMAITSIWPASVCYPDPIDITWLRLSGVPS